MDAPPNLRQLRWLLAGTACAVVLVLGAVVALQPVEASGDWARFLGRFHPLVVHLPIGAVLLVALAEVASFKPSVRARLDPVITPVLVLLLASAVAAFIDGLLLARGGGYPEALLVPHKALAFGGVVLLCASLAAWSLQRYRSSARWRNGYRVTLGLGVAALGVGAHFGGSMTHGESYLVRFAPQPIARWLGVEPPRESAGPKSTKPVQEPEIFANVVLPVLEHYCAACHGPDKVKGELRLDSYAGVMKGGESGAALTPGAPEKSRMLTLMRLGLADDDHMPPSGKPQPSPAEIELIAWWILRGAHEHERVREAVPPDKVFELLKTQLGPLGARSPAPEAHESGQAPAEPASVVDEPEPGASAPSPGAESTAPDDPTSSAGRPAKSGLVYDDLIAPLLAARCASCHGAQKQKGKLRLDTLAGLEEGGKAGPAVIPMNPAGSPLLQRVLLPLEADEHMPPKGEAQLTVAQIRLLSWWIEAGADSTISRERLPVALAAIRPPAPVAAQTPVAADDAPVLAAPESDARGTEVDVPTTPAPAELLAQLPPEVRLFSELIQPMLGDVCGDCHIGEPLMGDLSVASVDDLMASGTVVPGEPARSELFRRVTLPASDDERMPPAGEKPLSVFEIAALRFWIEEGAEAEARWPREQLPEEVARAVLARLDASRPAPQLARTGEAAAGQVAPVERKSGGGCAACAVGTGPGTSGGVAAALSFFAWLGVWKQRTRSRAVGADLG